MDAKYQLHYVPFDSTTAAPGAQPSFTVPEQVCLLGAICYDTQAEDAGLASIPFLVVAPAIYTCTDPKGLGCGVEAVPYLPGLARQGAEFVLTSLSGRYNVLGLVLASCHHAAPVLQFRLIVS